MDYMPPHMRPEVATIQQIGEVKDPRMRASPEFTRFKSVGKTPAFKDNSQFDYEMNDRSMTLKK